jgi:DNA-binding transcriptional LysR family regulator
MDSRLLNMFCAVAENGSLAEASVKLHLTPSAISHAIKSLETQLGCRLFERAGRRVLLNQAGEQLLQQVRPPLRALEEAGEALKKLGKWGKSRLRIGASASACAHILPRVFRELKKSNTQLEMEVTSSDTPELFDLVRANKLDLALGVDPPRRNGLDLRPLFRDELMFVFAASHPWAAGRPINREDLRRQPFILYRNSSITAYLTDEFFRKLNFEPSTTMEVGSVEAIKELVKLNLGVSVLAPWTVERELGQGSLRMRPLGTKPLTRQWVVASFVGRRLSLAEETFYRLCRKQTASMRLDRKDVPALTK